MRIPKIGEWWSYSSKFSHPYTVTFHIDDVIIRDPIEDSWIIYSNNDSCGYFVAILDEFINSDSYGNWEFSHDG
jgi:hypothetical protein